MDTKLLEIKSSLEDMLRGSLRSMCVYKEQNPIPSVNIKGFMCIYKVVIGKIGESLREFR